MASVETQQPPAEPALPDYVVSPNAVLQDASAAWRYGRAPDYSKTRKFYAETKRQNHTAGSLPDLVENLVKNWEIEASFKTSLQDWRTVDHEKYTFSINGGAPQSAEHMLKVGTYNAIIVANEFYSPKTSDFSSSHKTFKRMMPTFAWEVVEVYSGPPRVAFKWRHWGQMKNDYVGFNDKGEKVTAKAHGGMIDIEGITVAEVNDKLQVLNLETWFDPLEMFRQISPSGIVNKEITDHKVTSDDSTAPAKEDLSEHTEEEKRELGLAPSGMERLDISNQGQEAAASCPFMSTAAAGQGAAAADAKDELLAQPADTVHPHPKTMENIVQPAPGEAVAAPAGSAETKAAHEEMAEVKDGELPVLMNRE